MSKHQHQKRIVKTVNPVSNFTIRVLSVGHVDLQKNQWCVPPSKSLFWSIYIPENAGLELGIGKAVTHVPAGCVSVVPAGASAKRNNNLEIQSLFCHFDLGGFAGIQLADHCKTIAIISAKKFQTQIADLHEAVSHDCDLRLQLCVQSLISGVLAECVANNIMQKIQRSAHDTNVKQILPAIHAIEERLDSARCPSLKVWELAALCSLTQVDFSRTFFEATGRNPAKYCQDRKIAVAAQQVLFSKKSIDEIADEFTFSNRFYFSRVFKQEVGATPAAYRNAYHVRQ